MNATRKECVKTVRLLDFHLWKTSKLVKWHVKVKKIVLGLPTIQTKTHKTDYVNFLMDVRPFQQSVQENVYPAKFLVHFVMK